MSTKRKQAEVVSPPLITRITRRRFLSSTSVMSSSSPKTDDTPVAESSNTSSVPQPPLLSPGPDIHNFLSQLHIPQINYETESGGNINLTTVILSLLGNPVFINIVTSVLTPSLSHTLLPDIRSTINQTLQDGLQPLREQLEAESARIDKNEKLSPL